MEQGLYEQQLQQPAGDAPGEQQQAADPVFQPDYTPPNNTLYVSNLDEKIKEAELKHDLSAMFAQFGKVSELTPDLMKRSFELLR